ncbi:hypothetical protein GCM10009676_46420 [Prauserella halophila]|uniref:Uncharacterized protein n=1 Tax=Prauserella halophila TaxID=185641 RepID=A0ABN1WPM8_9PSEU
MGHTCHKDGWNTPECFSRSQDPSAPRREARWHRTMEEVRDDCDAMLGAFTTIIRETAKTVRACG